MRSPTFWILTFILLVFLSFGTVVIEHLTAHMVDQGWTREHAAAWYRFIVFMGIAGKLLFGLLADRIGARRAMYVLLALYAAGSLILLVPLNYVVFSLLGLASMLQQNITYAEIQERISTEAQTPS